MIPGDVGDLSLVRLLQDEEHSGAPLHPDLEVFGHQLHASGPRRHDKEVELVGLHVVAASARLASLYPHQVVAVRFQTSQPPHVAEGNLEEGFSRRGGDDTNGSLVGEFEDPLSGFGGRLVGDAYMEHLFCAKRSERKREREGERTNH